MKGALTQENWDKLWLAPVSDQLVQSDEGFGLVLREIWQELDCKGLDMPAESRMLYLHTMSPLHIGTRQGFGFIDLPIARDVLTTWPHIPGTSIMGALRFACRDAGIDAETLSWMFGSGVSATGWSAGYISVTDAKMLCFPVRSLRGTYAWVTCPQALRAWLRNYDTLGTPLNLTIPIPANDDHFLTTSTSRSKLHLAGTIVLEDLDFPASEEHKLKVDAIAARIATVVFNEAAPSLAPLTINDEAPWTEFFFDHFGIVSDDVFSFLATTCTPVTARVRIRDDVEKVVKGALWYEETVPTETIFSLRIVDKIGGLLDEIGKVITTPLQLGGKSSVGHGVVSVRFDTLPLAKKE